MSINQFTSNVYAGSAMNQGEIRARLAEAGAEECTRRRLGEIMLEFLDESPAMLSDGTYDIDGQGSLARPIIEELFISVAENRRSAFPDLFPVFAVLCGDRENGVLIADIDWSQAPPM